MTKNLHNCEASYDTIALPCDRFCMAANCGRPGCRGCMPMGLCRNCATRRVDPMVKKRKLWSERAELRFSRIREAEFLARFGKDKNPTKRFNKSNR